MNQGTEKQPFLADALPAFAAELRQLLIEKGEPELAAQVPGGRSGLAVTDAVTVLVSVMDPQFLGKFAIF